MVTFRSLGPVGVPYDTAAITLTAAHRPVTAGNGSNAVHHVSELAYVIHVTDQSDPDVQDRRHSPPQPRPGVLRVHRARIRGVYIKYILVFDQKMMKPCGFLCWSVQYGPPPEPGAIRLVGCSVGFL